MRKWLASYYISNGVCIFDRVSYINYMALAIDPFLGYCLLAIAYCLSGWAAKSNAKVDTWSSKADSWQAPEGAPRRDQ